jgi:transposase
MTQHTFIGLDVHARSVWAGVLDGSTGEVRSCAAPVRTEELVEWLRVQGEALSVAYEAGPTGFGLARACAAAGIPCLVAAPSKIAKAPGERVKTDRRDALRLAKLLRLEELTAVRVPSACEEGARDLVRAREDARGDLMRARHRLSKLLLRQGLVWEASAWTQAHERWLAGQRFEERGLQVAYGEAVAAVQSVRARRDALDRAIVEEAAEPRWADVVGRLSCLRGVSTLTAFGLATEIGEWERFDGRSIGAYLGLVPSENSSGERRRQGAITKTGNGHARRLLVEAAWHQRRPSSHPSRELVRRREGQPALVRVRAEAAGRRLQQRWRRFDARGKRSTVAAVAVARELAGWCWSLAVMDS